MIKYNQPKTQIHKRHKLPFVDLAHYEEVRIMTGENMDNYSDRRVFERFNVSLPVKFIDLRENQEGCAETCDVSAKGLCLELYHEVKPSSSMELWLEIPDHGSPFYTRGRVVWATQVKPNLWHTGINLEKAELMGLARIFRRS